MEARLIDGSQKPAEAFVARGGGTKTVRSNEEGNVASGYEEQNRTQKVDE